MSNIEKSQELWVEDLQARKLKVAQVTYPRTANNDKELTVARGEFLHILDDSRKWWKARNIHGVTAHVPHTIVTLHPYDNEDIFNNPLYTHNYNKNNYQRQESSQYSVASSIEPNSPHGAQPASADWVRNQHQGYSDMDSDEDGLPTPRSLNNGVPPPPPPFPSLSTPTTPTPTRATSRTNTMTRPKKDPGQEDMHEELKHVLTLFREKRKTHYDVLKTPEIYIQQSSSAAEVQEWLKAKQFSDNIRKQFTGVNGKELFALNKKMLEESCGTEEGKRLASQITLQKNVSGYKTARTSELQAILAIARQKIE